MDISHVDRNRHDLMAQCTTLVISMGSPRLPFASLQCNGIESIESACDSLERMWLHFSRVYTLCLLCDLDVASLTPGALELEVVLLLALDCVACISIPFPTLQLRCVRQEIAYYSPDFK